MDPKTEEINKQIRDARGMAKKHAAEVAAPKCAALCETSAVVLSGPEKSIDHFRDKSETARQ